MRFPEEFLNELKSRVRLSDVVGKKVSLKKRGKDWVGLSPFSSEKTPSFYVHDDRGFYKCFSTQKSGDAITFLTETERLTFAEAVEKLARDVGLELPAQSAGEAQQYRKRATLIDWVEKACVFFEDQLRKPAGTEAREYLQKRGFGPEAWARHRMGFAPDGWRALSDFLTKQGATIEELIEAGLLVQPDDGKQPWDRFRNRVIFPITDHSNRPIAFGARTLEPDGKPKYLNSSDSPLFHKGRTLYRYMDAREALAPIKEGPLSRGLIVTEGYVDAIALAEAGIGTAVAPLGTALTEEQLDLLWRAGPEPILCFDGDAAGIRAAWRACDRALPLIEPGKTLFFVLLPDGMDPDDVVRVRGAQEMRDMLGAARPLVDLLWARELEAEPLDTPERKAGFEARLMAAVGQIKHPGVKKAYERELRDRLYWHFRPGKSGQGQSFAQQGGSPGRGYNPGKKGFSPGPTGLPGLGLLVRAIMVPMHFEAAREALAKTEYPDPDVEDIRKAAFDMYESAEKLDLATVAAHLRTLDRKRAVELLEPYLRGQLSVSFGAASRDWLDAMERFPVARKLEGEVQSTKVGTGGEEPLSTARYEARLRAAIIDREKASRSVNEDAGDDSPIKGENKLRTAIEKADAVFGVSAETKRSED
ncbi:MAG: DNA primase [Hyphomonadaceae bacterium]|nr:DNA primase [Hyphomonadaceae bacterium]